MGWLTNNQVDLLDDLSYLCNDNNQVYDAIKSYAQVICSCRKLFSEGLKNPSPALQETRPKISQNALKRTMHTRFFFSALHVKKKYIFRSISAFIIASIQNIILWAILIMTFDSVEQACCSLMAAISMAFSFPRKYAVLQSEPDETCTVKSCHDGFTAFIL